MKTLLFLASFLLPFHLYGQAPAHFSQSLVRVNSTIQAWNIIQPWDKNPPKRLQALGVLLQKNRVLTTAEAAANATFIEFENASLTRRIPAVVKAVDYHANLAILEPANPVDGARFFHNMHPADLGNSLKPSAQLTVWQLDDSGTPLPTPAIFKKAHLRSPFVPGHYFLHYQAKASMQSSASSFSLPVSAEGKVIGILDGYNTKDQLVEVIAPEIIKTFLSNIKKNGYTPFPSLGLGTTPTVDPNLRQWLKLPDNEQGIYIARVRPKSAAATAGLKKGDVIMAFDGHPLNARGYYHDALYGQLAWGHLSRGAYHVDDKVTIDIIRDGKPLQIQATLAPRPPKLVIEHFYNQAPSYLIKGGFIFQELSLDYLKAVKSLPLNLIDVVAHPEDYEKGRKKVVFLSATIPTPATTGYESMNNLLVKCVNGKEISDMASLVEAFNHAGDNGMHTLVFQDGKPETIYLSSALSNAIDNQLLQRGIPALYRIPQKSEQ